MRRFSYVSFGTDLKAHQSSLEGITTRPVAIGSDAAIVEPVRDSSCANMNESLM